MSRKKPIIPYHDTLKAEHRERVATLYKNELFKLREFAFRILRNTEDAEDAVHDAFVHVLELRPPVERDLSAFIRTLVRAACKKIRRTRLERVVESVDSAPRAEDD
jgi:DNA-directed RNA polymerase specialized sigma24 family protein